jgi:acyl carrier protein
MTLPPRDEILEKLSGAIRWASNGRANPERLDDDAKLIEDIGLSSLDLLDLRFELEGFWQLTITNDEAAQLRTVGDIVRLIEDRLSAKRA